jgi:hypothetical protein
MVRNRGLNRAVLPLFLLSFYLYYPPIYLTLRPDFNNFSSKSLSGNELQDRPPENLRAQR